MKQISHPEIQAKLLDFALTELILSKRESFQPLWTVDSWAKCLIWMSLNCGLSGDRENLECFAEALGPHLSNRMRKIFFERTLEDMGLYLIADPADKNIFIFPLAGDRMIAEEEAMQTLENVSLEERIVLDQKLWEVNDSIISIPWKSLESDI